METQELLKYITNIKGHYNIGYSYNYSYIVTRTFPDHNTWLKTGYGNQSFPNVTVGRVSSND